MSCTIGGPTAGAQAVISIAVLVPSTTGSITTASASSTVTDTQPSNNSVSVTVQIT